LKLAVLSRRGRPGLRQRLGAGQEGGGQAGSLPHPACARGLAPTAGLFPQPAWRKIPAGPARGTGKRRGSGPAAEDPNREDVGFPKRGAGPARRQWR